MSLDIYLSARRTVNVFEGNITHNLTTMANAAGIYLALWQPESINAKYVSQLIDPLKEGLRKLKENPDKYKAYNPPNGWGDYDNFVKFVERYLGSCIENPDAEVSVSR